MPRQLQTAGATKLYILATVAASIASSEEYVPLRIVGHRVTEHDELLFNVEFEGYMEPEWQDFDGWSQYPNLVASYMRGL